MTKTKLKTRTIDSNGFKFVYIPSMHSMSVYYPSGRLELFHQLFDDKWYHVACKIMNRHGIPGY